MDNNNTHFEKKKKFIRQRQNHSSAMVKKDHILEEFDIAEVYGPKAQMDPDVSSLVELLQGENLQNCIRFRDNRNFDTNKNLFFTIKQPANLLQHIWYFIWEDRYMDIYERAIKKIVTANIPPFADIDISLIKHQDSEYYIRFPASKLNKITKRSYTRYPDILVNIDKTRRQINFVIPVTYFTPIN